MSAFTHLWNPLGYPTEPSYDEATYLGRAMYLMQGGGPQELAFYDHPYFGQIFLATIFSLTGYPNSFHIENNGDKSNIELLYLVPRILIGMLAIFDTFLIYKIAEYRYNRRTAFIASTLFAVMPLTTYLRLILLEPIQLPFFLASMLIPIYIMAKHQNSNLVDAKKSSILILISGTLLGIAIFTKIPIFAMIPLLGYLVYKCGNKKISTLVLWIIPVILIPLIWPLHAMVTGEFRNWISGVLSQTQRQSQPLVNSINSTFQLDFVLLILATIGLTYAIVKRDLFILLWVFPFFIFLYGIGYVSYWHLIPLIPAFCISIANLIVNLSDKVKFNYVKRYLPYVIVSIIGIWGLASTWTLIGTSVPSTYLESAAFVVNYLQDNRANFGELKSPTVIAEPTYTWILQRVFHLNYTYDALPISSPKVKKAILIVDKPFVDEMSGTGMSSINLRQLYNHSSILTTIGQDSTDATSIRLYDTQMPLRKILEGGK